MLWSLQKDQSPVFGTRDPNGWLAANRGLGAAVHAVRTRILTSALVFIFGFDPFGKVFGALRAVVP